MKRRYWPPDEWRLMPEPWRRFWWWARKPWKRSLKKHWDVQKKAGPES